MAPRLKRRARDPALHENDDPHQLPQIPPLPQPSPPRPSAPPQSLQPPSQALKDLSISPGPEESDAATPNTNRKIKIKLNVTPRPKFPAPRKEDNVPKLCVTSFLSYEQAREIMPGVTAGQLRAAQRRGSAGAASAIAKPLVNGVGNGIGNSEKESKVAQEDKDKALERNIDNVIFGDVSFKAWYPSWYPKEIIGEKALDGKGVGIVVKELFVCGRCFGYSKVVLEWVKHCRCCEREVPGVEVYRHGEGGRWAVWEVDGGVETVRVLLFFSENNADVCGTAILPKPLPLRKALPRQQIRLLRRSRLQLLPPRLHAPLPLTPPNRRFLLQRKNELG